MSSIGIIELLIVVGVLGLLALGTAAVVLFVVRRRKANGGDA